MPPIVMTKVQKRYLVQLQINELKHDVKVLTIKLNEAVKEVESKKKRESEERKSNEEAKQRNEKNEEIKEQAKREPHANLERDV